jgi:hypothetical protein
MKLDYSSLTAQELINIALSVSSSTDLERSLAVKLELFVQIVKQNEEQFEVIRNICTPEDEIVDLNIEVK